ncbi:hypothetical protein FACS189449_04680 [Alphaproteobacteria bacterium]|nr:hypothetical protein FACS189449_04680 [Alphaproteobacteria bacterium]
MPVDKIYYRIGEKLGFKRYIVDGKESEEIPTIDLSWQNIRRVFKKEKGQVQTDRAGRLNAIIKATERIITADDFPEKLPEGQVARIIDLCLEGEEKLFHSSHEPAVPDSGPVNKAAFRKHLELMLKNYTGFQRIMSMLAVSILNSEPDKTFVNGFTRLNVIQTPNTELTDYYVPAICGIKIREQTLEDDDTYLIFHELTHAYHAMVLEGKAERSSLLSGCSVPAYSLLNSEEADFVGLFFPTLVEKTMNETVKKIVDCLNELLGNNTIESSDLVGKKVERIVPPYFKAIIDNGLGNAVFPKGCTDFSMKQMLDRETLARAIYVLATAICQINENECTSPWSNCEEMLTITGLAPITDGENVYLFEDRQNEEIYRIRQCSEKNTLGRRNEQFRFHWDVTEKHINSQLAYGLSSFCICVKSNGGDAAKEKVEALKRVITTLRGVGILAKDVDVDQEVIDTLKNAGEYGKPAIINALKAAGILKAETDIPQPEKLRFDSDDISTTERYDDGFTKYTMNSMVKSDLYIWLKKELANR